MTHSACLLPVQTIHTCRACFCFKKAGGQVQKKNHPLFHPPRPVSHPWGGGVSGELERRARAAISIHIIESKWFETYMTHSASLLPDQTIHTCRACFCPERQEAKFKRNFSSVSSTRLWPNLEAFWYRPHSLIHFWVRWRLNSAAIKDRSRFAKHLAGLDKTCWDKVLPAFCAILHWFDSLRQHEACPKKDTSHV
jgi:hypothetical protein